MSSPSWLNPIYLAATIRSAQAEIETETETETMGRGKVVLGKLAMKVGARRGATLAMKVEPKVMKKVTSRDFDLMWDIMI